MNKKFTVFVLAALFTGSQLMSQVVIETFENGIKFASKFEMHSPNDLSVSVEENPLVGTTNPSEAVLMAKRKTAENFWTGFYGDLITEYVAASQGYNKIQLKYFRTSAKSTIRIKINGSGEEFEPITAPTKVNEWEVLEFDYRAKGFTQVANLDIRPDWRGEDEVEAGTTTYIDDITLVEEYVPGEFNGLIDDFENKDVLDWYAVLENTIVPGIVDNPTPNAVNSSNKVLKVVKKVGANDWEGVIKTQLNISVGSGEGQFKYLHAKILKPVVSDLTIKFQKVGAKEEESGYAGIANTLVNEWEYLVIDLQHLNDTYVDLFFQVDKRTASEDVTIYLDDIKLSNSSEPETSSIVNEEAESANIYAADNAIVVEGNGTALVYGLNGNLIQSSLIEGRGEISVAKGFYIVKINNQVEKLIIK